MFLNFHAALVDSYLVIEFILLAAPNVRLLIRSRSGIGRIDGEVGCWLPAIWMALLQPRFEHGPPVAAAGRRPQLCPVTPLISNAHHGRRRDAHALYGDFARSGSMPAGRSLVLSRPQKPVDCVATGGWSSSPEFRWT